MGSATPIIDFVQNYIQSGTVRAHMPGHKGQARLGYEPMDITEIGGADALYEAEGIIRESEQNASRHFGFGRTLYSAEGSSQCIRAMLFLATGDRGAGERPLILAARNVHKAFIHACALLDLEVEWLMPEAEQAELCSCPVTAEGLRKKLTACAKRPAAVYITSPDYLGGTADIAGLAEVCHSHGLPLLVDNAHGAYLKFLEPSRHPIDLGADMTCDSAHKTLPVVTGGAYLQISKAMEGRLTRDPKLALGLFGSTSPSYLILQSLDLCNRLLDEGYIEAIRRTVCRVGKLSEALCALGYDARVNAGDPLKLVIRDGRGGTVLADLLRGHGVEVEFADQTAVVMMLTPDSTDADLRQIYDALKAIGAAGPAIDRLPVLPEPQQVMTIREAVFAPVERIASAEAEGRICAAPTVSCPPAVPIAVSGEVITKEAVQTLLAYGIMEIEVVR